jgi:hypothetical protein
LLDGKQKGRIDEVTANNAPDLGAKPGIIFRTLCTVPPIANPSRSHQPKFSESVNKHRKAVEFRLPITMHSGQIIMVTKMLNSSDLRFYDFEDGAPIERWQSGPGRSS